MEAKGNTFRSESGDEFKYDRAGNVTRRRYFEVRRETQTGRKHTLLGSRTRVVGSFGSMARAKSAARALAEAAK